MKTVISEVNKNIGKMDKNVCMISMNTNNDHKYYE